jgi:nitroreductase
VSSSRDSPTAASSTENVIGADSREPVGAIEQFIDGVMSAGLLELNRVGCRARSRRYSGRPEYLPSPTDARWRQRPPSAGWMMRCLALAVRAQQTADRPTGGVRRDAMNPELRFLFARRSIRKFGDRPVSAETVRDLLEAAMAAPSASAQDPWHFVMVRQKENLRRIADALPYGKMLASAGLGIVACGDLSAAHGGQLSYLLQDVSAAIENILLAATALGLGACWLGVHPREDRIASVREVVQLPPNIVPVSVVAVGWPGEKKDERTRYAESKVHHEIW